MSVDADRSDGMSTALLWVIVVSFIAARLLAGAFANLVPDEAYYWLWSRHPSASYYDHPPMVAWWIWLSTALFGGSTLGVRALSILSAAPASAAVYWTGRLLFGRAVAAWGVIFLNATLLIAAGGVIATPDAPSVLFWSLATLAFALVVSTRQPAWWLAVGLCAGLGVLSKLTNLFLGLGLVLAILADRDLRRWLLTPWPWLGAGVAVAVVAPMLLWNADRDWVTFTKQFGRMAVGGLRPYFFGEFVLTQFLLLNPFVAIFIGVTAIVWLKSRGADRRPVGLLLATVLPLIAYMAVHSFRSKVEGNWPAPIYPTLALLAASAAGSLDRVGGHKVLRRLRALALPLAAALSALAFVVVALPDGAIPPKADFVRLVRGWPAFAEATDRLRQETGARWIATTNYSTNAELAYYLRDSGVAVVQITDRVRYVFAPPPDPNLLDEPALLILRGADLRKIQAGCLARSEPKGELSRAGLQRYAAFRVDGLVADAFTPGC